MSELDLVSRFALLALHPRHGVRQLRRAQLDAGLAGAVLGELVAAGRIGSAGGAVTVLDPAPTGHALPDEVLAAVVRQQPRHPAWWLSSVRSPRLWDRVRADLDAAGLVEQRRHRVLGLVPVQRRPPADPALRERFAAEVREVLGGVATAPDARTTQLAALVVATGLVGRVAPKAGVLRSRDVLRGSWVAEAVHGAIATADGNVTTTVGGVG